MSTWVVPLTDLRRTPGATRPFGASLPLGVATSVGQITIPADRVIEAHGQVESVGDGVLVTGVVRATLDAECARCLTAFSFHAQADIRELYVYPGHETEYADEDVSTIEGDAVDLGPVIHDALILDQPLITLCQPDCRGLCPRCGVNLNDEPGHVPPDGSGPRCLS